MAISTQWRGIGAALLVHEMAKGSRHFDPLRHTALIPEAWQEPGGGPWVRCRAAFALGRGQWSMVVEDWLTLRPDAENAVVCAALDHIAWLTDSDRANAYDSAQFIGLVRP